MPERTCTGHRFQIESAAVGSPCIEDKQVIQYAQRSPGSQYKVSADLVLITNLLLQPTHLQDQFTETMGDVRCEAIMECAWLIPTYPHRHSSTQVLLNDCYLPVARFQFVANASLRFIAAQNLVVVHQYSC